MSRNAATSTNNNPMSSAWFAGAPMAKLWTVVTVATFLMLQSKNSHTATMSLNPTRMRLQGEWYRLLSSKLTFATTGSLVTGTLLWAYMARKWEREMGSRKFVVFCVFVNALVVMMEFLLYSNVSLSWLPTSATTSSSYAGPYPLLGAFMMLFYKYTPRLYPRFVGILGFHFSEKALYYLWFAYVVGGAGGGGLPRPSSSSNMTALVATACGMVAAQVYTLSSLLQTCQVPPCPWLSRLSDRFLEAPPRIFFPQASMMTAGGFGGAGRQPQQRGAGGRPRPLHPIFGQQQQHHHQQQQQPPVRPNAAAAAPRPSAPPAPTAVVTPDPAAVEQLTLMGFDPDAVEQALRQTNNNVERAADRLLSQH